MKLDTKEHVTCENEIFRDNLLFFAPLILLADLLFFTWGKIILDVKGLANLFWSFTLDHVCNSLTGYIQQSFNIQIIGSLRKFKIKLNFKLSVNDEIVS